MGAIKYNKIFDTSVIKALSKEQRHNLAITIRRDTELWNAVNGVGGLSESSSKSRLQGTVIENRVVSIGKRVSIVDDNTSKEFIVTTNQQGYYSINLEPSNYTVRLKASTKTIEEGTSVETIKGQTSTLNFDDSEA